MRRRRPAGPVGVRARTAATAAGAGSRPEQGAHEAVDGARGQPGAPGQLGDPGLAARVGQCLQQVDAAGQRLDAGAPGSDGGVLTRPIIRDDSISAENRVRLVEKNGCLVMTRTVSTVSTDLQIDPALRAFVADELLAGLDLEPEWFWSTLARAAGALRRRGSASCWPGATSSPAQIDAWHREHGAGDAADYEAFLNSIGYLVSPAAAAAHRHRRRRRDRRGARPAAGRAGHRAALRAERRQRPLGLAVRRPLRHRRAARSTTSSRLPARPATTSGAAPRSSPRPTGCSTSCSRSPPAATPTSTGYARARRRARRDHRRGRDRRSADPAQFAGYPAARGARPRSCCAATGCTSS